MRSTTLFGSGVSLPPAQRSCAPWDGEVGQQRLAELDLDIGTLGDPQRVVARFGEVAEQVAHLGSALQVVLGAFELESLRVAEQRPGLHAQQCVVRLVVLAVHVVRVVGRDDGGADLLGDLDQLRVGVALGLQPVILQFDEQVVLAEDLLQPPCLLHGALLVALHQCLQDVATQAPGGGDQAVVVLLEQLPVHARLVVVALQERQAGQLDEVAVPLVVLGQQGEVVVQLLATLGVAARVVDPAATCRALVAAVVGHVGLGADDRLHALLAALLEELEDAVHVAVISDTQARLAILHRLGHEFVETGRAVEHRELGMDMQVGERVAHDADLLGTMGITRM